MFYIRMILLCCILVMSILSLTFSQPAYDLREKLERLLEDPEYNDIDNEIHKQPQIHGMLLKDLREHGIEYASSEERFFDRINNLEKTSEPATLSQEETYSQPSTTVETSTSTSTSTTTSTTNESSTSSTTTLKPPAQRLSTTATTKTTTTTATLGPKPLRVMGGLERLSTIISKIIEAWRQSS